ncbi:MAG TPA: SusD/RagB family nutrient-binding outer membrane lipoprotein [Gemmatimonadaceae bacterium]|nr:SusD/RagB family nutrient-binding outer membrane lipoprotein [Gemmatimonadaceae bacterium]
MTSRKIAGLFAAFVLSGAAGCGDFLSGPKLTDDPNKQQDVRTPEQYFVPIQANMNFIQEGQLARFAAIWHQQMAGVQRQFSSFDVYTVGEADVETEWSTFYGGGGILDARKLQAAAAKVENTKFVGVAKIYEAWLVGTAADVWGDVPYSEAVNDAIATPKLDKQMDVYAAVEALLSSAITDLGGPGNGPGDNDLVYGGDIGKWIAFAHTLKARYYLHMAEVDATNYAKALAEAQKGIQKGGDYRAYHSDNPNESNTWYQFQLLDRSGYMVAGKALVDTLKNRNDPRLAQYFGGPPFVGSGAGENREGSSDLSDTRLDPSFAQPFVTWRENQLIIAEAAFKTGNTALALASLNAERADVGLGPVNLAGEALYGAIMTEKWIEDFQKIEVFQDYNRSCYPKLTPAPGSSKIPGRLLYPINERNSNPNVPAPSAQSPRNQNDPVGC